MRIRIAACDTCAMLSMLADDFKLPDGEVVVGPCVAMYFESATELRETGEADGFAVFADVPVGPAQCEGTVSLLGWTTLDARATTAPRFEVTDAGRDALSGVAVVKSEDDSSDYHILAEAIEEHLAEFVHEDDVAAVAIYIAAIEGAAHALARTRELAEMDGATVVAIDGASDPEVRDCPFCGVLPSEFEPELGSPHFSVCCINSECGIQPSAAGPSASEARELWNTRAES